MFNDSSIMVLLNEESETSVRLLEVDKSTQDAICEVFSEAMIPFISGKEIIPFNGNYKPNEEEVLSICNFPLPEVIANAIRDPLGLQTLIYSENIVPNIKAVFIGSCTKSNDSTVFSIAFQRFRREQYLSTKKFNLFFEENIFKRDSRWGIGITEHIDCVYTQDDLRFFSYFYARQIFNLREYYRAATDDEVQNFSNLKLLSIDDKAQFLAMADTWIRRKIAAVNDSDVLNCNTATHIKSLAQKCGLEVTIENDKVVIPADKKKFKEFLGFLDDEVYKGAFSEETYITNSKRIVQ